MNDMLKQLRDLPTANLAVYLLGLFAVIASMIFLHGIKPAYAELQELQGDHRQLMRLVEKFAVEDLQATIDQTKKMQHQVRTDMLTNIPDRKLDGSLPTILEELHRAAKRHGLRTQKLQPGNIERNAEIATVPISIQVVGHYQNIFSWIHDFTEQAEGFSVADISADRSPGSNGTRTMAMNLVIYGQ